MAMTIEAKTQLAGAGVETPGVQTLAAARPSVAATPEVQAFIRTLNAVFGPDGLMGKDETAEFQDAAKAAFASMKTAEGVGKLLESSARALQGFKVEYEKRFDGGLGCKDYREFQTLQCPAEVRALPMLKELAQQRLSALAAAVDPVEERMKQISDAFEG